MVQIIISLLVLGVFLYFVTTGTLKKLKTETSGYYPFDMFLPHSGVWSVGTFLLVILCLGLLIVLLAKGSFYHGPA